MSASMMGFILGAMFGSIVTTLTIVVLENDR